MVTVVNSASHEPTISGATTNVTVTAATVEGDAVSTAQQKKSQVDEKGVARALAPAFNAVADTGGATEVEAKDTEVVSSESEHKVSATADSNPAVEVFVGRSIRDEATKVGASGISDDATYPETVTVPRHSAPAAPVLRTNVDGKEEGGVKPLKSPSLPIMRRRSGSTGGHNRLMDAMEERWRAKMRTHALMQAQVQVQMEKEEEEFVDEIAAWLSSAEASPEQAESFLQATEAVGSSGSGSRRKSAVHKWKPSPITRKGSRGRANTVA